jgi:hypothetical protein
MPVGHPAGNSHTGARARPAGVQSHLARLANAGSMKDEVVQKVAQQPATSAVQVRIPDRGDDPCESRSALPLIMRSAG